MGLKETYTQMNDINDGPAGVWFKPKMAKTDYMKLITFLKVKYSYFTIHIINKTPVIIFSISKKENETTFR